MDIVLGGVPLLMVALGFASWPWLAYVSAALALLLLVALLAGTRGRFAAESRKLFDRG